MKKSVLTAAAAAASLFVSATSMAQVYTRPINDFKDIKYPAPFDKPQIAPEIPFDPVDPNWFKMPPAQPNWNVDFGEVAAVTTNSKGHVFVLNRNDVSGNVHGASATQVLEFDDKGNYVREIGHGQYGLGYGHGIRVDKDDNIWVVDKGTNMVTKFSNATGKVMMVLGRRDESTESYWREGAPDRDRPALEGRFGEPTDVAWDSKGNIYISDGYIHSRIAKFDKDGHWIGTWGKRGVGPGEFRTPHAIQIDANDHIWVGDRSNGRIQIFDTDGKFLREIILNVPTKKYQPLLSHQYPPTGDTTLKDVKQPGLEPRPGTPYTLCSPPDNKKVMFVGDIYPGRIYKVDLSGKVLGYFGHVGKRPGDTGSLHGLACPNENTIYTAEFINDRVQRFVIHPEKAKITNN